MTKEEQEKIQVTTSNTGSIVLSGTPAEPTYKVCEVCGYANPKHSAMCKNCSNYLEGEK